MGGTGQAREMLAVPARSFPRRGPQEHECRKFRVRGVHDLEAWLAPPMHPTPQGWTLPNALRASLLFSLQLLGAPFQSPRAPPQASAFLPPFRTRPRIWLQPVLLGCPSSGSCPPACFHLGGLPLPAKCLGSDHAGSFCLGDLGVSVLQSLHNPVKDLSCRSGSPRLGAL